jgi:hypothetical protein
MEMNISNTNIRVTLYSVLELNISISNIQIISI